MVAVWSFTSYFTNYPSKTNKTCKALLVKTNLQTTFSHRILHINAPVLADQQRYRFIRTLVAVERTYQERWTIRTDDVKKFGKYLLSARRGCSQIKLFLHYRGETYELLPIIDIDNLQTAQQKLDIQEIKQT